MSVKLILPFSTSNKRSTKNTFKIMNEKDLLKISKQKGKGLLNIIKKTLFDNSKKQNNVNNKNIKFTKASNTKEYYKTIQNKKGGNIKSALFPSGLSGATVVLGLAALQHSMTKQKSKQRKKVISKRTKKSKSKSKK